MTTLPIMVTREGAKGCRRTKSIDERFWAKVDRRSDKECWPFTGYIDGNGRGNFHVSGKTKYAHQVAAMLYGIRIPAGLQICHRCDNPRCCNPGHYFIGSAADNMADMDSKGRRAPYSPNFLKANVKYPRDLIERVRSLYSGGLRQFEIMRETGLSRSMVHLIVRDKTRAYQ